nr:hypothetical protein [Lysinibacillus timonensis]
MIGLIIAIFIFNIVAFKTNKRLTTNQIIHIWTFTMILQLITDIYLDLKYHGYWYFYLEPDWLSLPAVTVLTPPVNILFLNWYPFHASFFKRLFFVLGWSILVLTYEAITLLPEPWGYFHYGWWKIWYSALCYPVLLMMVLFYYKWICKIEKSI